MISQQQAFGRGIRVRNQAMICIGREQGRVAVLSCFLPGITAECLFRGC